MVNATEPVARDEEIVEYIANAALEVRSEMGTGLLDDIYRTCLIHELQSRGLDVKTNVAMPITYEGITVENAFKVEILVEDSVLVKVKPVCSKWSLHEAQLLTYVKHSGRHLGLLLDFDTKNVKNCVRKIAL